MSFIPFILHIQDQVKAPKSSQAMTAEKVAVEGLDQIPEEGQEGLPPGLNSDEEVEIEEIVTESLQKRFQRSTKQQIDNMKKPFSKEKMEKTKLKTRENLEKTKQRTRENLEKTKHSLEKKIGKIRSNMTPNQERRAKIKSSREKLKKSLTPDHKVHARSKTTVYRVPPFTFHVKKIREGEQEQVVQNTEMVEVTETEGQPGGEENGVGVHMEEGELVSVDSHGMEALLEVTEDSQLVSVEPDHLKKAQHK